MRCCVALSLLAAVLPAQVHGRVLGFDGEPCPHVRIRFEADLGRILGDVLTQSDGTYAGGHVDPVVRVHAQIEGVRLSQNVERAGPVDFTFEETEWFTIKGHVVDPRGVPANTVDLRVLPRNGEDGWIAVATTDHKGAFSVRVDRPVQEIVADPLGWRYRVRGPWRQDTGLAIDLRLELERFFQLRGTALDEDGRPLTRTLIKALGEDGRRFHAYTGDDGSFCVWANAEIERLALRGAFDRRCEVEGSWTQSARVDLDCRTHGLVPVIGQVVDRDGKPVKGALLYPSDARGKRVRVAVGSSGENGWFRILVVRGATKLFATKDRLSAKVAGPWIDGKVFRLKLR